MKPDPNSFGNIDTLESEIQKLGSVTHDLHENFQKFRKAAGADIKKLTT